MSKPPNPPPDVHLLAVRLARGLGAQLERGVREHGVSLREHVVLAAIAHAPGSSQLAIARASGTDKSALVAILDRLETRGLITRAPDPKDRRARLLDLTPDGRATLRRSARTVRETEERLLDAVPAEERGVFLQTLTQIAAGPMLAEFDLSSAPPPAC